MCAVSAESRLAESPSPAWAWAPYEPDAKRPWDLRRAGHLYRRAAFGATWPQLQAALADGPARTIDRLLRPQSAEAFNRACDEQEAGAVNPEAASDEPLRDWWLRRMIETPHALLEKMTLFWHSHFGTNGGRVENAGFVQQYLRTLRQHALGRYSQLLRAICRDPATAVSLDLGANTKTRPSRNLAQPLLELFTVGPGGFSEQDVAETARALTGWSVFRRRPREDPQGHDSGHKRILGQEGDFGADDVVRVALARPATPRLVVRKIYRYFVSESDEPSDAMLAPLAEPFARDYDVAKLVETVLRSNLFFSPAAYRRRIKGPVEFALGIVRPLEGLVPTAPLGQDLAALGQDLCRPPTVRGWQGGQAWINQATVVGRANLAAELVAAEGRYGKKLDPASVAAKHGRAAPDAAGQFVVDLFLQGDVEPSVRERLIEPPTGAGGALWLRQLAHSVFTMPEFQLG